MLVYLNCGICFYSIPGRAKESIQEKQGKRLPFFLIKIPNPAKLTYKMMNKPFLGILFFITILFDGGSGYALTWVSVGAGPEYFSWKEFDSAGRQVLEEKGYRVAAWLHLDQIRKDPFLFGYSGKLYGGSVNYDGQTWGGTPVTTDTGYSGLQNEGSLTWRYPLPSGLLLDLKTGLGWDRWRRSIKNPFSNSDQVEVYDIFYLKIGPGVSYPGYRNQRLWMNFGGKLPFYTFEDAQINRLGFDQNPPLHPGKQVSLYLSMGYQLNSSWEIAAVYDSYRFSPSQKESVTQNGTPVGTVIQPESSLDLYGIHASYRFP